VVVPCGARFPVLIYLSLPPKVSALVGATALLPAAVARVLHPLVAAAGVTAASLALTGIAHGDAGPLDAFRAYSTGEAVWSGRAGAGDLLGALLNAAVAALGIRMFQVRDG